MSGYTPGPWSIYANPVANPDDAKRELALLVAGTKFTGTLWMIEAGGLAPAVTGCGPQSEANAHLVAAAPELLAACETALELLTFEGIAEGPTGVELRAAIAKARAQ